MNSQNHGFTLIELMIAVAIVGVLVAISIPLYQDFVIRARVTEVLLETSQVKTDVSGFVASNGRFPATQSEREQFEITPADAHPSIQRLALHGVGACNLQAGCKGTRLEVKVRSSLLGNGTGNTSQLQLEGSLQQTGSITWVCGPRDVQGIKLAWLPSTCRHQPG